jgi:hypothetical protein
VKGIVRIVADRPTFHATRVYLEDGRELPVFKVELRIEAPNIIVATVAVRAELDVKANGELELKCPRCMRQLEHVGPVCQPEPPE